MIRTNNVFFYFINVFYFVYNVRKSLQNKTFVSKKHKIKNLDDQLKMKYQ